MPSTRPPVEVMPNDVMKRLVALNDAPAFIEHLYPGIARQLVAGRSFTGPDVASIVYDCVVTYARGLHPAAKLGLRFLMIQILLALLSDSKVIEQAQVTIEMLPEIC